MHLRSKNFMARGCRLAPRNRSLLPPERNSFILKLKAS